MRIPITKDGINVLLGVTLLLAATGLIASYVSPWSWVPLAVVWLWAVSFFRDPTREIDRAPGALYAPADGKIAEVVTLDKHEIIAAPCYRIRIFLSIFNVHVNRVPCAGTVQEVEFKAGRFLNALNPHAAEVNEACTLVFSPQPPLKGPLVVRQIAGLIARTIVCHAATGDAYRSGQRFGMIKFGSTAELVVPCQEGLEVKVRVGDRVRAGLTVVAQLDKMS